MNTAYRLHYAPDNASLIVRLVLDELGQPFETALVDRGAQTQRSAAYLALNPNGLIPVLETPDGPIFETAAICLWLADRHQALFPAPASAQRGAALKWLFFTSNTLHAALRMLFYPEKYIGPDPRDQARLSLQLRENLHGHLRMLDALTATCPPWLGAETPSLLDLYIPACLRWLALYPKGQTGWFQLSDTPHLHALAARTEGRPSVRRAIDVEGLGPLPFTRPMYATPPEGSAT